MELSKLLENESLDLPRSWDDEKGYDFINFIKKINNEYLDAVDKYINDIKHNSILIPLKDKIENLSNNICEILDLFLKGRIIESYNKLNYSLNEVRNNIEKLVKKLKSVRSTNYLYRIRIGDNKNFTLKQMFHIPFDERYKVESWRYSISGNPCLYLGGSIYVCWEELERVEFHKMHISRFSIKNGEFLKVLDFRFRPSCISQIMFDKFPDFGIKKANINSYVESYIVLWPLIAACSIKVRYPKHKFKPEYIIPQLLLQWVREEKDIDGINYFSTKITGNYEQTDLLSNYAFPAKEICSEGYCNFLSNKFLISTPINWQIADNFKFREDQSIHGKLYINPISNLNAMYEYSKFGEIEAKINCLNLASIENINI